MLSLEEKERVVLLGDYNARVCKPVQVDDVVGKEKHVIIRWSLQMRR